MCQHLEVVLSSQREACLYGQLYYPAMILAVRRAMENCCRSNSGDILHDFAQLPSLSDNPPRNFTVLCHHSETSSSPSKSVKASETKGRQKRNTFLLALLSLSLSSLWGLNSITPSFSPSSPFGGANEIAFLIFVFRTRA